MSTPTRPDTVQFAPAPVPRRRGPLGLVQRHPLLSFFTVAFAASWLCWLPYLLSAQGLGVLDFRFPGFTDEAQLLGILPGAYVGPLGAALLVTLVTGGRAGLRDWKRRLLRMRVGWYWYPLVVLGVTAMLIGGTLALPGAAGDLRTPSVLVLVAFVPALVVQILTTGLAEEPGWRDLALPLLQRRHGAAVGTLILGVVWAFWHLPLFFTAWSLGGTRPDTAGWWSMVGTFLVMCVAISFIITWVFNHTNESLPLALLLHATNNNVASLVLPEMFKDTEPSLILVAGSIGYGTVALVLLIVTRGRLGYTGPRD
ncbi:CPBP family intramembrane metalloprotease [Actinomadura madurae]|uniref:CAAX protease self-immunity n=1 Tax=Actinomadura madurae TaxID=1993 RepID=A0A1I5YE28_9ACTN|nr:CPBP family intramembrane glutamic endopeptidase [Actinomadura madurae]SFQ42127.1 CAAX protease self-immunity [Actinomadura madurae]SPT52095.1 CAAX amino terminal protease self- immunity [Actinomadura madurae]